MDNEKRDKRHYSYLVSDETFNGYDAWRDSEGVTLPGNQNATYNAGLSPLFTGRYGRWPIDDTDVTDRRGWSAYLHSNTARDENRVYFLALNDTVVYPLQRGYTHRNNSLRCLVSTNNRIIDKEGPLNFANLVSDDIEVGKPSNANEGITLPNGSNATHNIELSPLFFNRSGRNDTSGQTSLRHGQQGYFWPQTSRGIDRVYRMGFTLEVVSPSYNNDRAYGHPLRCLVSTNNR